MSTPSMDRELVQAAALREREPVTVTTGLPPSLEVLAGTAAL